MERFMPSMGRQVEDLVGRLVVVVAAAVRRELRSHRQSRLRRHQ
jgi:hypothetical protein